VLSIVAPAFPPAAAGVVRVKGGLDRREIPGRCRKRRGTHRHVHPRLGRRTAPHARAAAPRARVPVPQVCDSPRARFPI